MKIKYLILLLSLFYSLTACEESIKKVKDYKNYHAQIMIAEELIGQENYKDALQHYERIFKDYDFIFLRDYKVTSQLSLIIGEKEKGLYYLKKGISNGWELKNLKNNYEFFKNHLDDSDWGNLIEQYNYSRKPFLKRIDSTLKNKVQLMFEKDQKIAFKASLIEDEKEQEAFILEEFPKHSEKQLKNLFSIIENHGYPGEFLIGNDFWVSTILSHHNSIAQDYTKKDTLYDFIKPTLFQSLNKGYVSPYEIALVEDWKKAVISDRSESAYGFVNPPTLLNISQINKKRNEIGLRSVELRNKLIDIEQKTGMNFYLPDWVDGKITIGKNDN